METLRLPSIETPCLKPSRPNSPAAYRVALRTRTGGTWLDLELDLWKALADTVKTWGRESLRCR